MPFQARISGRDRLLVRFSGPLTEVADLDPVRFKPNAPVEIDLGEVTTMNSVGVRSFGQWSNRLNNPIIELSHCPKVFINQLNLVRNLIPSRSRVISFYVPYFSESANEEKNVLFTSGLEYEKTAVGLQIRAPIVKTSGGSEMDLDVIPARYFQFLERFA